MNLQQVIALILFYPYTRIYTMKNVPRWSYNGKEFRSISNSEVGEVSDETTFYYQQKGAVISAHYQGGNIREGNILGRVESDGTIKMSYQHWNKNNEFRAGVCTSTPERLPNGKIRLHESWEWTNGIHGSGKSIIEEI